MLAVLGLVLCLLISACKKMEEENFLVGKWNIEATLVSSTLWRALPLEMSAASAQESGSKFVWYMVFSFIEGPTTTDEVRGKVIISDETYNKPLTGQYLWDKQNQTLIVEIQYTGHPDWRGVITCKGAGIAPGKLEGELKVTNAGTSTSFQLEGFKF